MMKTLMMICLLGCQSVQTGDDVDASTDADGGLDADAGERPDGGPPDAPPDSGPTCTNTLTDPENCGACGRSCLGAVCAQGSCVVELVGVTGFKGIGDFTSDGLFLYYTGTSQDVSSPHRLWKQAFGGSPAYLNVMGPGLVSQIDTDANSVYMAESSRIVRLNKEPYGGDFIADSLETTTYAVHLREGFVYWATNVNGANNGDIKRVATTGGQVSTLSAVTGLVTYIKSDATHIYWAGAGLKRIPLAGGIPTTVLASPANFLDMDDQNIYLVSQSTGDLLRQPKGGGQATVLATGADGGGAVDDEYVYYGKDNLMLAVPKGGGQPITLWTGETLGSTACPSLYTVTQTRAIDGYVYFLAVLRTCNNAEIFGQIRRVARL